MISMLWSMIFCGVHLEFTTFKAGVRKLSIWEIKDLDPTGTRLMHDGQDFAGICIFHLGQ